MNRAPRPVPLAYFITFTCYGARLHGDASGTVDRHNRTLETPHLPPQRGWARYEEARMPQPSYQMDAERRRIVLQVIKEVCQFRGWTLLAGHVRSNHVHIVVHADRPPEEVMTAFKAYASRRLTERKMDPPDRRRWTRHGSTRYLWTSEEVEAAIRYVVHEQGEPMAVWENESRLLDAGGG